MRKIIAWMLMLALILSAVTAVSEEVSKYDKLTVSTTTPFTGNFLSEALGNNISDLDVRRLIHGYNLVYWDGEKGSYQFNPKIITDASVTEDGTSFIFALAEGLKYCDGTPITARDYAFSLLLLGSPEMREATGSSSDLSRILGGRDYQEGKSFELKGLRVLGDYQFTLSIDPEIMPYFYQLKLLDISPLPISVIAPGCEVADNGQGAFIEGEFTAEVLEDTLLNPIDGYISYPKVTAGPYMLTDYTGNSVDLVLNPEYIGDKDGEIPTIPRIIIQKSDTDKAIADLSNGRTDLVVRCLRGDQVTAGMMLAGNEDFAMKSYSRPGLSFISFCAEKGPTKDVSVRQALSMCIDKTQLALDYTRLKLMENTSGTVGMPVDGFYGIGQWMFLIANGQQTSEDGTEEERAALTLDVIPKYEFNPAAAEQLLEENGWEPDRNGLMSKAIDGEDVSLSLKLIYPEGNGVGPMLDDMFIPYLDSIGIELQTEAVPMETLLKKYYGQEERDCDMILLGTNFSDVFDPSGEYDENGKNRLNGITDPELRELAINMRSTEPGRATEYCSRWLAYQARLAEIAAEIPLYSNAYFDFHISALQDYEPARSGNWSIAVTEAVLSDFVPEEEKEEEEEFELEGEEDGTGDLEGEDLE